MTEIDDLPDLPPELTPEQKAEVRARSKRAKRHGFDILDDRSDEWVAAQVRVLTRDSPWHEAICLVARDRLMRLKIELEDANNMTAMLNVLEKMAGDSGFVNYNKRAVMDAQEALKGNLGKSCPDCLRRGERSSLLPGEVCSCGYRRIA